MNTEIKNKIEELKIKIDYLCYQNTQIKRKLNNNFRYKKYNKISKNFKYYI